MAHLREMAKAAALVAVLAGVAFAIQYSSLYIFPYISFVVSCNASLGYPYSFAGWCMKDAEWKLGPDTDYTYIGVDMSKWHNESWTCLPEKFYEYGQFIGLDLTFYSTNVDLWRHKDVFRCLEIDSSLVPGSWKVKNTCPCRLGIDKKPFGEWSAEVVRYYPVDETCTAVGNWTFEAARKYEIIENVTFAQHVQLAFGELAFQYGSFELWVDALRLSKQFYKAVETEVTHRYETMMEFYSSITGIVMRHNSKLKLFKEKTPWWMFWTFAFSKLLCAFTSIFGIRNRTISFLPILTTVMLVGNIIWQIFKVAFALEITYFNLLMFFSVIITLFVSVIWWIISVDKSEDFNEKILKNKVSLIQHRYYLTFFLAMYKILTLVLNSVAVAWCYSLVEDFLEFFTRFEGKEEIDGTLIICTFFICIFAWVVPNFLKYVIKRSILDPRIKTLINVLNVLVFFIVIIFFVYYYLLWTFAVDLTSFLLGLGIYLMGMTCLRRVFLSFSEFCSGHMLYSIGDHEAIRFNALMRWMSSCATAEIFSDFARLMSLVVILPSFSMVCLHLKWITVMIVVIVIALSTIFWQIFVNLGSLWSSISQHIRVKGYNNYDIVYCKQGLCPRLRLEYLKKFYETSVKLYMKEAEMIDKNTNLKADRELRVALENAKMRYDSIIKKNQLTFDQSKVDHEVKSRVNLELQKTMGNILIKAYEEAMANGFDEELGAEWNELNQPDMRTSVERYFKYSLMCNLSQMQFENGEFLSRDDIRNISSEVSAYVPYEWKKNFGLMTRLFSTEWEHHRVRLIQENDLTDEEVTALERIRRICFEMANDGNHVVHDQNQFAQIIYGQFETLKRNVWIKFIENVENQIKSPNMEFAAEVPAQVVNYRNRQPNVELNYWFNQEALDVPFTSYYVRDVWASTEMEACQEAEKWFINSGLDATFNGVYNDISTEICPGEWQVKCTDKKELHITTKAYNLLEYLVTWVCSVLMGILMWLIGFFGTFYSFFTGALQADIVKEFIEFLQTQNYFPSGDNQSFEELLLNQNEKKVDEYKKKLDIEQQRSFELFKDLITINPGNYHKFKATFEIPSAKEILNAYNKILTSRRQTMDSSVEYTAIRLDLVYSKILRPYIMLPTKLPKQLQLYSYRQTLYLVPSSATVPESKFMPLQQYKGKRELCIVLSAMGNHFIAGHETKTCHYLHNKQECPATYRCYSYSGWESVPRQGKITYLYSNLNVDHIVLNCDNLTRTFCVQNSRWEVRVPYNDLYYMTSPLGIGKFGILTSGNVNGITKLFTAAHVVSFRGDGNSNLGPGQWGEVQVRELDKKAQLDAMALSISGEIDVLENGNIGTFYAPRWFRMINVLNQNFLGKVSKLDREGAVVDIYDMNRQPLFVTSSLDVEQIDLHTQEKQAFMIRLDRESETQVFPVAQPFYTLDSNMTDFSYVSAPGDSGSPIIRGSSLKAIHLGGYNDGTGGAFVGVISDKNGVHFTSVKKINNEMVDDTMYNKMGNHFEDYQSRPTSPAFDSSEKYVTFERQGDRYRGSFYDGKNYTFTMFGSLSEIEHRIKNGDFENFTILWVDRGETLGDKDIEKESKSWTDLVSRYTEQLDDIRGQVDDIANHVNISLSAYTGCASLISEEQLSELLQKDEPELLDFRKSLVDELSKLRDQLLKLKVARDILERDPAYKKKKKDYEIELLRFAEDRAQYEVLITQYRKLKEERAKLIQKKTEEVAVEVKKLTEKKNAILQKAQDYFTKTKNQAKILNKDIQAKQMEIAKQKSNKKVDEIRLAEVTSKLDEVRELYESAKEQYRILKNERHKIEMGETEISKELLDEMRILQEKIAHINQQKKQYALEVQTEVAEINKEIIKIRKELDEIMSKKKPQGPSTPKKPRFQDDMDLVSIREHITRIGKLNKQGEKIKTVIDLILKDQQSENEMHKLSKLSNQSISAFDSRNHGCNVYDARTYLSIMCPKLRQMFANMLATSIWWELKDGVHRLAGCNSDLLNNDEFIKFIESYFRDCCEAICEDFEISEVKIDFDFVQDVFEEGFCRNQSGGQLANRYVLITPKLMTVDAVLQNIIAPIQPVKVACAFCDKVFQCDTMHIGQTKGTVQDLACTLYCQRAVLGDFRGHVADCKLRQNNAVSFMSTSASPVQFLTCLHQNGNQALNKCPIHKEQVMSCLTNYSKDAQSVPIIVNAETQYIDIQCLYTLLYRMAKTHEFGNCDAGFSEEVLNKLKSKVSQKQKKNAIQYSSFWFDVSDLTELERAKFLVSLSHVSANIPVCSNQSDTIEEEVVTQMEQKIVEALENQLEQKFTSVLKILDNVRDENKNLKETIAALIDNQKIEKDKYEARLQKLEQQKKTKEVEKEVTTVAEDGKSVDSLDSDDLENQTDLEQDLPEKVPMGLFVWTPNFKPNPGYRGPKCEDIWEKLKDFIHVDDTPYGKIVFINKTDFMQVYESLPENLQKKMLWGVGSLKRISETASFLDKQ